MPKVKIGNRWLGEEEPVYFIADIGANHDGMLERAKALIWIAKEAGVDAVKFQNFRAPKIVSKHGFEALGTQLSHQSMWKKSVYEAYEDASIPWEWSLILKAESDAAGIDYLSTPYDFGAVDMLDPLVPVFKIGSGDITWPEMLEKVASKGKPVILSTGASDISDIQRAVHIIQAINPQLVLMQCNTSYTGSNESFKHIHLNVLLTYRTTFPGVVLGLSSHALGHVSVLGAVTLGARVIEKHLTDDRSREGPDHSFAMVPETWREMVDRTRELESALGGMDKRIEENEQETVIVQRRCLRAVRDLQAGTILTRELIDVLRPAPLDAIFPYDLDLVLGKRLCVDVPAGAYLRMAMLGD